MSEPGPEVHKRSAATDAGVAAFRCGVLTVSDTRTPATDESGDLVERTMRRAGAASVERRIVRDEPEAIRAALERWVSEPGLSLVISTGGTGIGRRDTTIEVVRALVTAELDGFGELFRALSYREIGSAAMLSRAAGGLVARPAEAGGDTFVFALPGSPHAVATALDGLIVPELRHLLWERRR